MLQHVRVVAFAIYREISDELELQIVLKEVATLPKLIDDPDIVKTDNCVRFFLLKDFWDSVDSETILGSTGTRWVDFVRI